MKYILNRLIGHDLFTRDTACHGEDFKILWAPTINKFMDHGFTNRHIMKCAMLPHSMDPACITIRSVFSYLNAAYDLKCRVCGLAARSRPLFGNDMHGWRVCKTCKRNKFIEISTACTRFGITDLLGMEEFKRGIIKACPMYTTSLNDILYVDPSATMLKPIRMMYLVDLDSLKEAFGGNHAAHPMLPIITMSDTHKKIGEDGLIERAKETLIKRTLVYRIIELKRARDIRMEYESKFSGGKHKAASCRTMDRFSQNSTHVHNPWLKRSPNQYYLFYAGDK